MDAYRRAAPHLLNELAHLLSLHKWSEQDCIPRGIVNILNYSWHDLTLGAALHLRRPAVSAEKQRRSKVSLKIEKTPCPGSDSSREKTREREPYEERNDGSRLTNVKGNQREKKKKTTFRGGICVCM